MPHLALNSSKDSSWCSDRRRDEVLKVGRAIARGRATAGRSVVVVLRRKKEVAGPRAAIRRRDIFFSGVAGFCATVGKGETKGEWSGDAKGWQGEGTRPCKSEAEWSGLKRYRRRLVVLSGEDARACEGRGRGSFQVPGARCRSVPTVEICRATPGDGAWPGSPANGNCQF